MSDKYQIYKTGLLVYDESFKEFIRYEKIVKVTEDVEDKKVEVYCSDDAVNTFAICFDTKEESGKCFKEIVEVLELPLPTWRHD
jgi:hypothetical protein